MKQLPVKSTGPVHLHCQHCSAQRLAQNKAQSTTDYQTMELNMTLSHDYPTTTHTWSTSSSPDSRAVSVTWLSVCSEPAPYGFDQIFQHLVFNFSASPYHITPSLASGKLRNRQKTLEIRASLGSKTPKWGVSSKSPSAVRNRHFSGQRTFLMV